MIVQAMAAKLQWFISQELQSSRWVILGAFGTLPPRNNDLAIYRLHFQKEISAAFH